MKYFLQHNTVFITPLGECEDFSEACNRADAFEAAAEGPSWIIDEESMNTLFINIKDALQ